MKLLVTYIVAVVLAVLAYGGVKAVMRHGDEPAVLAAAPPAPSAPTPATAPQKPQVNVEAQVQTEATQTAAEAKAQANAAAETEDFSFKLTYQAIKRYFPEDAALMLANVQALKQANVSQAEITAAGGKFPTSLREKYAADVYFAPDAVLKQLIGRHLAVLEALRDDPLACGGFQLDGQHTLTEQQRNLLSSQFDALSATVVEAMYQGKTTPQKRAPLSQETQIKLLVALRQSLTLEDLQILVNPDAKNPRTCAVHIAFLQAAQTADFEGADALRAEIVRQAVDEEGLYPQQTDKAVAAPPTPAPAPQKTQPDKGTQTQMDAEAPSHPPIYEALQKYFPQDGASILTKLRELRLANAPKSEGHAEAAKFWVSMREKYGDDTYFAADELLKKLIARRLELFEVLRDDPLGCAGFLLRGEQALTPLELFPLSEPSIALAATTVEVMYHGRTTPQNRASMSYMVYDRMFDSLKDVLTEKDLLLLDQPDAKNRRSCEVYRLYLRAALNADFDGADRLRAQMALDMQYGSPYRLKWPARPANAAVSVPLPSSPASTANMRRVENWARTSTDADADAAADEDMRGFFTEELSMDLTYPAIKRYFPQDVAAMQAKYRELKRADVPRPGMAAEGVKFTASLREKYAAAIHVAPDAALKKLLASRLALLEAFGDDPLTCNRVLMEGQSVLTQQQQSSVSHLSDALAAAAAEAIHQGRTNPQNRAAMSPKTVERLFSLVQKDPKGLDLTLLRSPDLQNPRTCAVHRTYLRTILAVDFDEMETIRALSAQEMLRM